MCHFFRRFSRAQKAALFGAFAFVAFGGSPAAAQNVPLGVSSEDAIDETADFPGLPEVSPGEVPVGSVGGMGDINLYPKRVVIDARQRIASVGLYNKAAALGDYEITVTDMLMTSEGQVYPVDNLPAGVSAERLQPASSMLRWSPRRVALQASEAQTIRIMARPPADLPDGEYRSHFMVVSVPSDVDDGFSIEDAAGVGDGRNDGIGVVIRPRFGISIPVIVRVGETTLDVGLQINGLIDVEGGKALALNVLRSGTRSAFGDIVVTAPGQSNPVAIVRGVGIYPEVDSRRVVIPFDPAFDLARLRSGMALTVTYVDDDFAPGSTLARQDFIVP